MIKMFLSLTEDNSLLGNCMILFISMFVMVATIHVMDLWSMPIVILGMLVARKAIEAIVNYFF